MLGVASDDIAHTELMLRLASIRMNLIAHGLSAAPIRDNWLEHELPAAEFWMNHRALGSAQPIARQFIARRPADSPGAHESSRFGLRAAHTRETSLRMRGWSAFCEERRCELRGASAFPA